MPKTIGMVSLGCAKNRVDSENMLGILRKAGYKLTNRPDKADVVVINTCGFIESAKEEAISTILEYVGMKADQGMPRQVLVTGCLVQRYGEELKKELPEVDGFMGVAEYDRLLETLGEMDEEKRPLHAQQKLHFTEFPRVLTTPPWTAYVKISDGCDNKCTYCAIPLIRGAYRSRSYEAILNECRALAAGGVKEITLIAQDTSRYGNDFPGGKTMLAQLLRDVNAIDGVEWVRVLYCYPDTVDEELLDTIAELPKVCNYLDLPLQHINADILRRMNRRGSPEHIRKVLEMCRERGITTRTTFIVGFPGETEAQFEELLDFVKEARFARMGAFPYSPEDGTAAAEMAGQLDEETKQARFDRIMTAQQAISRSVQRERLGKTYQVLVEGRDLRGRYTGRSMLEAPEVDGVIRFTSESELTAGSFAEVSILAAKAYDLIGEAVR
ncbi:MAG: 30S ribosomal protein S12 methylthiotransferase RimO [Eubacteriales bacterium]|nr:30S ribosomal protein S12 methylthiotransferase RimO [Eubacteriales bacterium]